MSANPAPSLIEKEKLAWQEATRRPGCRVVSFNWGPWDGGMVHAGLKPLFAREGVGLIPLAAGARLLIDELRAGPDGPQEVVVLAPAATPTPTLPPAPPTAFERVLDVAEHPVLRSHVLDGRPVLPAALMLEWLAHAAMVQNPGLAFHGCDDLRVLHGVVLDGPAPTLRQSGDVPSPAGAFTYYPSVEIAANGDIAVTYLQSSATEFLSMYVAGRQAADPLNTLQAPAGSAPRRSRTIVRLRSDSSLPASG